MLAAVKAIQVGAFEAKNRLSELLSHPYGTRDTERIDSDGSKMTQFVVDASYSQPGCGKSRTDLSLKGILHDIYT